MIKPGLYMCLGCGSIGSKAELLFETLTVAGPLAKLFEVNSFGKYVCPKCRKNDNVVMQQDATVNVSVSGTPWAPPADGVLTIGQGQTNTPVVPIPTLQVVETKEADPIELEIPSENAPVPEPVRVAPTFTSKCDLCNKAFTGKVDGATRCKDCLANILRGNRNG